MLASMLNCDHIDADEICRRLLEPHAEGWQELVRISGTKYLAEEELINRSFLRQELFTRPELRQKINRAIHPLVRREIITQMDSIIASDSTARVLVEVPLLYEVGWEDLFDTIIVVYADYKTCCNRLMDRDGMARETAMIEMESQMPLDDKVVKADHVIDNSGILSDTNNQVKHLAELLLAGNKLNRE